MTKSLLSLLRFLFSNDINIKIYINLLFDDFKSNCIIFFLLPNLSSDNRLGL